MVDERATTKHRGLGLLAVIGLVGALLVPLAIVSTASAGPPGEVEDCGVSQASCEEPRCPERAGDGATQGDGDICCREDITLQRGLAEGDDVGVACCPDGTFGHWEWGGANGQNLYYCDAPPAVTVPPTTDPPAVSPATAAPKKAAVAAKPVFTG